MPPAVGIPSSVIQIGALPKPWSVACGLDDRDHLVEALAPVAIREDGVGMDGQAVHQRSGAGVIHAGDESAQLIDGARIA